MMIDKKVVEIEARKALEEHHEHRTYISDVTLTISMRTGYKTSDVKKILDELITEGKFTNEEYHVKMGLINK